MMPRERFRVLYERYLRDECGPEELEEMFLHFADRGKATDLHDVDFVAGNIGPDIRMDGETFERVWRSVQKQRFQRKAFAPNRWLKVAAAAVFLLAGTFAFRQTQKPQKERTSVYEVVYRNDAHRIEKTELPDGTAVFLKPGSRIVLMTDFADDPARQVLLEGEAFFAVPKRPDRPFVVKSANGFEAKVLGTRFNLKFDGDRQEAVLTEGSLSIENALDKVLLSPRQKAVYVPGRKTFETEQVDTLHYVSWIRGQIHFSDSRLEEVAAEMNRYYGKGTLNIPVRAKGLLFTGYLPADNADRCIEILNKTFANHNIVIN